MVDLGFGLVHTLVPVRLCGLGVGERVVGAVWVAGAGRLAGLPVRPGGQVPLLEVADGLRQVLTVVRNVPRDDRPAILGALADRFRGVLDLPLPGLAARRRQAGRVFRAEMLGLGAGPTDLGFSGRSAGGLAGLPVAPGDDPAGGLVDRRVG
jgi:hypothetical protein